MIKDNEPNYNYSKSLIICSSWHIIYLIQIYFFPDNEKGYLIVNLLDILIYYIKYTIKRFVYLGKFFALFKFLKIISKIVYEHKN